jgi:SAM-dependent methyltransferase
MRCPTSVQQAWQGEYAERWLRAEVQKDRQLAPLGRAALAALAPRAGEWVVDVGCGAGSTTLELAALTGPSGGVCAIDVSEPMLERARERCAAARLTNVQFALADAATHRFDRRFDALFSRFGVMFFEQPSEAFQNLRRSLVPDGRLAFVCWQALDRNPWAKLLLDAVIAIAPDVALPDMLLPDRPGPFYFAEPERVQRVLREAGFAGVGIAPLVTSTLFGTTLAEAVDFCMETGPAGRFIVSAGPERSEAFRSAVTSVLAQHTSERGTWLEAAVFVVTARSRD